MPSPTHILTLGVSASGRAEAKEEGGNEINSSTATEEYARRGGPASDDGGIDYSPATEECARRERPAIDEALNRNLVNSDERTDTEAENEPSREEDIHIDAEDSTVRAEVTDMLSEFKDMWSGRLGTFDATKHCIEIKPGARPFYQATYRAGPTAREKKKKEIDGMLGAGVLEPATAECASPVGFVPN